MSSPRRPTRETNSKPKAGSPRPGGAGKRASRKRGRRRSGLVSRIIKWGLIAVLAVIVLVALAFWYGYSHTTIPNPNRAYQAQTTLVYYKDGHHELGRFATQNRTSIPLSEVPQHVQDAVIAAEDRTFYTNHGIDVKSIIRAAFSNAQGNPTQGASTITQQYVKVLYLTQQRTITRKIKEAFLALKIQRQESKSQILQGYLNTIYFGRGSYGIEAAAHAYFNEDARQLTVKQGAVLAAVLNSPAYYDPANGKAARQRLLARYRYVLNGMAQMGTLSHARAAQLGQSLPRFPKVKQSNSYAGQKGYMLALVRAQLEKDGFSGAEIDGGGLRVTTTFTRKAMHAARKAAHDQRPKGRKFSPKHLHVAVASVDPRSGGLAGFYAGQDYVKSNGAINWAVAGGSPGSAFKPFAMSAGIKYGFSLKSTFDGNSPYVFPNGSKVVNEGPYGGNDYGAHITFLTALEQSVNTAFVDMTVSMKNGPQKILNTAVDMGIPRNSPGLKPTSGISLGSATINPITMANAYGTIADGGKEKGWYVVSKVTDANGRQRYLHKGAPHQALPNKVDRDVSYAMRQVIQHGTGQNALALGRPAAGKTGTATNQHGDVSSSWFVGFTPQLSTAVMYVRGKGNGALNGYLPSYFGADYPTRTWTEAMRLALAGTPVLRFPPPAMLPVRNNITGHAPFPTYTPTPTYVPPSPTQTVQPSPTPTHTPPPPPPPSTPPPSPSTPPPSPSTSPSSSPTFPISSGPPVGGGGGPGGGGGNG